MPTDWVEGTIGDLVSIEKVPINPARLDAADVDLFSIPAFDAGRAERVSPSAIKSHKIAVGRDTILVSRLNPHIPRTWWPRPMGVRPALASTEFVPMVPREGVDHGFAYQVLRSSSFFESMAALVTGTTGSHQRVDASAIVKIPTVIPPLEVQHCIAGVLGALDDVVEHDRRMRDAADGLGLALVSRHAADGLEMLDGAAPAGWSLVSLGEGAETVESGSRPKGGVGGILAGVPSIGAESIKGIGLFDFAKTKYVSRAYAESMKRGRLQSRDVLVYKDGGKPGEFRPHVGMFGDGFPFEEMTINEHVYRVRAAEPLTNAYLYFWLSNMRLMDEMAMLGTGAAIPGLNSTAFKSLPVAVPPRVVRDRLFPALEGLVAVALDAAREARDVGRVRDQLLPLLMSGRVTVGEAAP